MDDLRRELEDQNGLLSIILRHFHSTLYGYDAAGKESVLNCNNSDVLFLSLYTKRNSTKKSEIL